MYIIHTHAFLILWQLISILGIPYEVRNLLGENHIFSSMPQGTIDVEVSSSNFNTMAPADLEV